MPRKKVEETEMTNSEFMTVAQFQREIVPLSAETIVTYIKEEGLPASKVRGVYYINRKGAKEWFKRKEIQAS